MLQQVASPWGTHTMVGPGFHLGEEEGGGVIHSAAPRLGEHTHEVLSALGLSDQQIGEMGGGVQACAAARSTPVKV
ncbi:hypothetical protein SDC9_208323 [bioreactor metagenome]|uniref:Formyl-CoA transferase n=1 Tax=bioreactor metagenome TaxID=1076179 RepID=A0A645JJT7_9ZZZZ